MRNALLTLAIALLVTGTSGAATPIGAQELPGADLPQARSQFQRQEPRAAAATVRVAAAFVRQQLDRCRDEAIGMELLAAESRLERLADRLRAGQVGSVRGLDTVFAAVDRTLARHHWKLAATTWASPRQGTPALLGRDLSAAAGYLERALMAERGEVDAVAALAITEARRVAARIAAAPTAAPPKETGAAIEGIGRLVVLTTVAAR